MNNDNRISAVLDDAAIEDLLSHVRALRAALPFLISLSVQDRKELPKMGDKSIGFDEKCEVYMASNPEFLPGFVNMAEVTKDRVLRAKMMRFYAELTTLSDTVDDSMRIVASEVWMADLAYYQSVREAARRGHPGAQAIYDDLRKRFPGSSRTPADTTVPPSQS